MSMPFPGMDPYLEHPALWPGLHNRLIVAMANQLQPRLRPRYIASIEERVYLERPQQQRVPDMAVQKTHDPGGSMTPMAPVDAPVIREVLQLEIHESTLEILDRYDNMKLVALLEVVSPANKEAGPGQRSYLNKQREVLARDCHLVEIDLLRRGRHVLSVPHHELEGLRPFANLCCINRWPDRHRYQLYPRRLPERLPRLGIPLAQPDPDVLLDIQTAVEQVHEEGSYLLRLRYDELCEPPLEAADQQWANECWAAYRAAHPELFPERNS